MPVYSSTHTYDLLSSLQGKSLSLICGALKWLADCEQRERERVDAILAGKMPAGPLMSSSAAALEAGDQKPSQSNKSGKDCLGS